MNHMSFQQPARPAAAEKAPYCALPIPSSTAHCRAQNAIHQNLISRAGLSWYTPRNDSEHLASLCAGRSRRCSCGQWLNRGLLPRRRATCPGENENARGGLTIKLIRSPAPASRYQFHSCAKLAFARETLLSKNHPYATPHLRPKV